MRQLAAHLEVNHTSTLQLVSLVSLVSAFVCLSLHQVAMYAVKHTHTMHRHVIAGMMRELDIWSRYHPGNASSDLPEEARLHGAVYFVHAKTWEALIHDPSTRHRLHICMSMSEVCRVMW